MLAPKFGPLIRKRKHPARRLDDIDPKFNTQFDEAKHGEQLRKELNISHLTPSQQTELTNLIKEFWCVFDSIGLTVPIRDYECEIDTGDAPPVCCKNVHYGQLETPKIERAISQLLALGLIYQVFDGAWLSKGLLAP